MKLARALAAQVPLAEGKGLVLELGAGTGRVTEALLEKGVDPARLVVVERDRLLAHYLKNQFENVAVIHGNALKLCELCNRFEREVGCVVSSLPLLSLPPETVDALGQALSRLLGKNGLLIQYTYRLNNQQGPLAPYLERVAARTVIYNIPPARVEIFKARSGQAGE
jgi:phospholipid N-methyltransferase